MVNYQKIPDEYRAQIKDFYLDVLTDKHECYSWKYSADIEDLFMIEVLDAYLIMDCAEEQYPNITILNAYKSPDEEEILVRLNDFTFEEEEVHSGYIAIGKKLEGVNVYVATLYHNIYNRKGFKK